MTPHLHLHLEPGERAKSGRPPHGPVDRESFFRSHSLAAPRAAITQAVLSRYLTDLHWEQRLDSASYVELRLSPRRMLADGLSWSDFLTTSHHALSASARPTVRAILLVNRDSPADFVAECTEVVHSGLPSTFVGIDLAGDELAFPDVGPFVHLFATARAAGLGATVHAGEFGGPEHIWRAVDELGASRIGHGVSAYRSDALVRRLAQDDLMVEVSLISNRHLGAVPVGVPHPAFDLVARGVPICFNADVPRHIGATLTDELRAAAAVLGTDEVARLQEEAGRYAFDRAARTG